MNNKGTTFAIWVEIVIFLGLFLGVLAIIGANMNETYNKDNDLTFGLNLSSTYNQIQDYSVESVNDTTQGQASISDFGIFKLTTAPVMLVKLGTVLWDLLSGQFIVRLVAMMNLGSGLTLLVSGAFRIVYTITIIFLFLKLVLKIDI